MSVIPMQKRTALSAALRRIVILFSSFAPPVPDFLSAPWRRLLLSPIRHPMRATSASFFPFRLELMVYVQRLHACRPNHFCFRSFTHPQIQCIQCNNQCCTRNYHRYPLHSIRDYGILNLRKAPARRRGAYRSIHFTEPHSAGLSQ